MLGILAGSDRIAVASAAGTVIYCLDLRGRIEYTGVPVCVVCLWIIAMRRRSLFEYQTVELIGVILSMKPGEGNLSDCWSELLSLWVVNISLGSVRG